MIRRRDSFAWASLALVLGGACASSSGQISRSYERPELRRLSIDEIDVVVSVMGPPVASPPTLNVPAFAPPNWTSVLKADEEDGDSRDALVGALRKHLRAAGYAVKLRHSGARPPEVVPAAPVETSTAPMSGPVGVTAATSTAGAGSTVVSASPPPTPSPLPSDELTLGEQATLREVLDDSAADAVLVVRAVPVDAFYLFESTGRGAVTGTDVDGLTAAQAGVQQERAVLRSGRLLVGQAFLFDRRTGLRLWSRQLPDFPADGRIVSGSRLLAYGVVTEPGERELMPKTKAALAAANFVATMLEGLPAAQAGHEGHESARVALEALDASEEQAKASFLDRGHMILGLDTSWSLEPVGLDVTLDEETVDTLGTGAVAGSGVFRFTPRVGYQWPGGLLLSFGVPLGFAPNQFSRTYHLDNPDPNAGDPNDVGAQVSVGRPLLGGVELTGGYAFVLDSQLLLQAQGGVFLEVWSLGAKPNGIVPTEPLYRAGALIRADLSYRLTETGPFFVRGGAGGRFGYSTSGPAITGVDLRLGLGVFL